MKTNAKYLRNSHGGKNVSFPWWLVLGMPWLLAFNLSVTEPAIVTVPSGATDAGIQMALDSLPPGGGSVVLLAGTFDIRHPIVLQRNHQTLRGAGSATVLRLADGANCPVIIMGEPVNNPPTTVTDLCVSGLFIDGNRTHQTRELWRLWGQRSEIRNNGICVQNVSDSIVERATCARCRSGGLVTTRGVRRLTVQNYSSFDNEFDGLACYQTEDSRFTDLYLYDNPGAGISVDLGFNHNVISNAVLSANNLGIFMRASRNNRFYTVSIRNSRQFGVFLAQRLARTARGWQPVPQTACVDNSFTDLAVTGCGGPAYRINDATCVNNVITQPHFDGNLHGGLSVAAPLLATMR
jgi:nitrous oxidase accessory protein NosD